MIPLSTTRWSLQTVYHLSLERRPDTRSPKAQRAPMRTLPKVEHVHTPPQFSLNFIVCSLYNGRAHRLRDVPTTRRERETNRSLQVCCLIIGYILDNKLFACLFHDRHWVHCVRRSAHKTAALAPTKHNRKGDIFAALSREKKRERMNPSYLSHSDSKSTCPRLTRKS